MTETQLTKDDVKTSADVLWAKDDNGRVTHKDYVDFSKFQKVLDFFDTYKDNREQFEKDFPDLYKEYSKIWISTNGKVLFEDWLHDHCFRDGLK